MDKKKSEQIHAKRRVLERYGIELTQKLRDTIRGKIKRQDGKFLYRTSLRVSVWSVIHDDKRFKVVYDKQRKEIVSFLPPEE